ncbi:hypothetical protein FBY40_2829 [Microbacterium sp. SLBN-154]|uniref:hypothetical protein n=1 Tax=Microbacterium sp. SLBN-154 TaxID=2768458 RepID=UPI00114FCFEB|nr:hypothetical protein [Microbacterium sp. SLBN-154]TQK20300.1 hypothetical protein FBY40_2829 [Microbacterium sp. SLBN-154]
MRGRSAWAAALALTVALAAAGCSQIAAIAPVGGDRLAEVRYAVNDILIEEGIDILVAPVCTVGADEVTVACEGSTRDERAIDAVSEAASSDQIVVRVDDEVVYEGSLMTVLERGSSG